MWSSAQIDFSRRVSPRELPELMDGDCSYEDFRDCLRSLEKVNRWLLGYRPTLRWLERVDRHPCRPDLRIELAAARPRGSLCVRGLEGEVCERLRRGVDQGDEP